MSGTVRLRFPQTRDQRGRWIGPNTRPKLIRQPGGIVSRRELRDAQTEVVDHNRYTQEVSRDGK